MRVVRAGHARPGRRLRACPRWRPRGRRRSRAASTIHSCSVDEVQVERVGVGVLVDEREGDVVGLVPGQCARVAPPFAAGPSPAALTGSQSAAATAAYPPHGWVRRTRQTLPLADRRQSRRPARSAAAGRGSRAHVHRVVARRARRRRRSPVRPRTRAERLAQGRLELRVALGRPEHDDAVGAHGARDEAQAAGLVEAGVVGPDQPLRAVVGVEGDEVVARARRAAGRGRRRRRCGSGRRARRATPAPACGPRTTRRSAARTRPP